MEEAPEFFTTDEIIKFLNKFCMIGMCALEMKCKPFFVKKRFGIQAKSVNPYNSSFEMLTQDLKRLKRKRIPGGSDFWVQNKGKTVWRGST